MTSIFLSYSRDDDEPFVRRLRDDLIAAGFDVWFDRVNMPSRGPTFHQEIRDAIAQRDRVLLVVGPQAVASEYVRQEWEFAYFVWNVVIVTVFVLYRHPNSNIYKTDFAFTFDVAESSYSKCL